MLLFGGLITISFNYQNLLHYIFVNYKEICKFISFDDMNDIFDQLSCSQNVSHDPLVYNHI